MRPALPCSPGNRRPPCDQPHLAAPAIAVHHATSPPCRPGNRRPPCDQPHLAAPAIAACHADQPTLQTRQPPPARHAALLHTGPTAAARRRRSLVKQTVVPRSRPCRPPPQPKGIEGHPEGPAVGRGRGGEGRNRKSPQPYPAGLRVAGSAAGKPASDRTQPEEPAIGRGRGGEGCNRKARSRIRHGPAQSLAEFFRGLCTICKPKYTF